jgi:hypothetical protein
MSLQSLVRDSLSVIGTLLPETALIVISNGQTATGIKKNTDYAEALDAHGERGVTGGAVIIDASKITRPEKGSTILCGGSEAIVLDVSLDAVGSHFIIVFQYTNPITTP